MMTTDLHAAASGQTEPLLAAALSTFRNHKSLVEKAIAQLPDEALHRPLDGNTNSIAVIMKHVAGNLCSRWTDFLDSDGEKPWRDRDQEFVDTFASRQELLAFWEQGWESLLTTLGNLQPGDLGRTVTIRGERHSVPLAICRSLAHCGYHAGQIVLVARILAGDHWQTLTIPRGGTAAYNQRVWGAIPYAGGAESGPDR